MFDKITNASSIVINKVENWLETAITMLPNFIIAILVLLIFYFLSKLIRMVLGKVLNRSMNNDSVIRLILSLTGFAIMLTGIMVALSVLKLDKTVTSVLAGVGVIGLALGFAFQDAAANFISGVVMAVKSPINIGDIVETNSYFGTVKRIGLRSTTVTSPQGQDIVLPNRLIFQNPYTQFTINGERRIDLEVGISYGDDLEKVEELSTKAIESISYLKEDRKVEFFYTAFGDSSINFVVRYWVNYGRQPDYFRAISDGIKNLKKTYNENDITIPFPIRTLDFGIKGGEKLDSMLNSNNISNKN
jgi:small conductance mechanosensitive channel